LPTPEPTVGRGDLGFLLAKAAQHWNELLAANFAAAGFADVRPAYGSVLLPLYEQDGLRMGELARRARLSKQTMTTLIPRLERDGLVERRPDPGDARAQLVFLTPRSRDFAPVVAETLHRLDGLARSRLGAERLAAAADALRELMELEEPLASRRAATGWRSRSSAARPAPT
jgi:MarR family transcriptional regulator for hemolysin